MEHVTVYTFLGILLELSFKICADVLELTKKVMIILGALYRIRSRVFLFGLKRKYCKKYILFAYFYLYFLHVCFIVVINIYSLVYIVCLHIV